MDREELRVAYTKAVIEAMKRADDKEWERRERIWTEIVKLLKEDSPVG